MLKKLIKALLRLSGHKIEKIDPRFISYPRNRTNEGIVSQILDSNSINLVLDIGANTGDWSINLRNWGYNHNILSFEPLAREFNLLNERTSKDLKWESFNLAIGEKNYSSEINISNNSVSSSLSQILPNHIEAESNSEIVGSQLIEVVSLDAFEHTWFRNSDSIFLKVDVQGFEKKVLVGAQNILSKIKLIQLELSFNPLYSDDTCFNDMVVFLQQKGFLLYHLENGFRHSQTQELLQVDAIFINNNMVVDSIKLS
jgi:FkbM family methyltransferase